jgi:hypothetical protein
MLSWLLDKRGRSGKIWWVLQMCKWVMQKMLGEKEELLTNEADVSLQMRGGVFL